MPFGGMWRLRYRTYPPRPIVFQGVPHEAFSSPGRYPAGRGTCLPCAELSSLHLTQTYLTCIICAPPSALRPSQYPIPSTQIFSPTCNARCAHCFVANSSLKIFHSSSPFPIPPWTLACAPSPPPLPSLLLSRFPSPPLPSPPYTGTPPELQRRGHFRVLGAIHAALRREGEEPGGDVGRQRDAQPRLEKRRSRGALGLGPEQRAAAQPVVRRSAHLQFREGGFPESNPVRPRDGVGPVSRPTALIPCRAPCCGGRRRVRAGGGMASFSQRPRSVSFFVFCFPGHGKKLSPSTSIYRRTSGVIFGGKMSGREQPPRAHNTARLSCK